MIKSLDEIIVTKRNGDKVPWDSHRVVRAIVMAAHSVGVLLSPKVILGYCNDVLVHIVEKHNLKIHVEEIQDYVEERLMKDHPVIARHYILYRNKRAEERSKRLTPDSQALMDYIHVSKYGRWIKETNRRENYHETCDRVEEMHKRKMSHDEKIKLKISEAFRYVRAKKILPSMRSMQFGGESIERNNVRMYNCAFTHIDRLRVFAEVFHTLLSGSGVGYSVQLSHVERLPEVKFVNCREVRHYQVSDSIEGWSDAVNELIRSYFVTGDWIEFSYGHIRREGAALSSGGKAPGHLPLKRVLERLRGILNAATNRKLRPLECSDMICHIAEGVLAGGIRRSSLIALFSIDDYEMMTSKVHGNYRPLGHIGGPFREWRGMANISAVCIRNEVTKAQFVRILKLSKEWGCPGFYFADDLDFGCNPCGEIGMMPRLLKAYPSEDRSMDFDWRKWNKDEAQQSVLTKHGGFPYVPMTDEQHKKAKEKRENRKIKYESGPYPFEDKECTVYPDLSSVASDLYGHTTGWQFCNLVEINGATVKSKEDFVLRAALASRIATLQAGFNHFHYLGPVTELVVKRESLIGVGITGVQDCPSIMLDPKCQEEAAKAVIRENSQIAKLIGIPESPRCTTGKPSGTASLELGCVGSGMHYHHAKRYFRRVTANPNEPPFKFFKQINPHMCEEKPNGDWIITFCVEAPKNVKTVKDASGINFIDEIFSTYEHWIKEGTRPQSLPLHREKTLTHNLSTTVALDDNEYEAAIEKVWENRERVAAMTFFIKYSDKAFPFAPREEVCTEADEAKWNAIVRDYTPVDWSQMVELEDGTTFTQEPACAGGTCEGVE